MDEKLRNKLSMLRTSSTEILNSLALNGIMLLQPFKYQTHDTGVRAGNYPEHERRNAHRMRMTRTIYMWKDGTQASKARLLDVSLSGMYVATESPLDEGQEIKLSMRSSTHYPNVIGRVVRKEPKGMALQFI